MSGVVLVKFNNPAPSQVQQTATNQQQQPGMVPMPWGQSSTENNMVHPSALYPKEQAAMPAATSARADMYGGLAAEEPQGAKTEQELAMDDLEQRRRMRDQGLVADAGGGRALDWYKPRTTMREDLAEDWEGAKREAGRKVGVAASGAKAAGRALASGARQGVQALGSGARRGVQALGSGARRMVGVQDPAAA